MDVRAWPVLLALLGAGCGGDPVSTATLPPAPDAAEAPRCGAEPVVLRYDFAPEQRRSYVYLPFVVTPGTGRVEVGYRWTDRSSLPGNPLTATTVDLGLWDARGLVDGFRGWGGSRQGRLDQERPPVFVSASAADRGFEPGPIQPGLWHVELGLAAASEAGADVEVELRCLAAAGSEGSRDVGALDPTRVARAQPGWYAGDFHMHGYHSNPEAPDWEGVIAQAREAQLDVLMLTDYVTTRHHAELAQVQAAHPDLLLWPGREVITYFGHANVHGEQPGTPEYRHGYGDITMGLIQQQARAAGALFQVNHPTIFPPPVFSNLCRGCAWELDAFVDYAAVDLVEVVSGPPIATGGDIGLPLPGETENPFIATAIDWWLDKLRQGFRITAVSASDSKGVDAPEERARKGYGSSATQVYAQELSRPALREALRAGRAYIQVRGVADSPRAELRLSTAAGEEGSFGSSVAADQAMLQITLEGAQGQLLTIFRDALPVLTLPVATDPFVYEQPIFRVPFDEGPLGTIWRFETRDARSRTLISNPVYLRAADATARR